MPEHYDTPTKAKIQGAVQFLEAKGIPYKKSENCSIRQANFGDCGGFRFFLAPACMEKVLSDTMGA